MMQIAQTTLQGRAGSIRAALYLGDDEAPIDGAEPAWRVVLDDYQAPFVTVMPPETGARSLRPWFNERMVLSIAPDAVRNERMTEAQRTCDPFLYNISQTLRSGLRLGCTPPQPYLESVGDVVCEHLEHFYPVRERRRERRGLEPGKLSRVLALIDERLDISLGVEDLAAAAHLSPFHFGRMFCRSMGISPHAFITQRRIECAKNLLATSDISLAEIAKQVGYRNQAHFTRVFHQVSGTTPRRFRVANRRQAADDS